MAQYARGHRMGLTALLLLALAAPPVTAVADLSVRPEPELARALRDLPDLAGTPLPAHKASAVVGDAAKLGIVCSISDARCLQKILVLARVDELIAFEVSGRSLSIARITARTATFAKTRRVGSAAASAKAAWAALERAAHDAAPPIVGPPEEPEEPEEPEVRPGKRRAPPPEETATASSDGVTPTLVVAGVAGGAAVLLGAATLGVSAVVANQIRATEQGVPLDASYDAMNTTFWVLLGATGVAAATGAVAGVLAVIDAELAAGADAGLSEP